CGRHVLGRVAEDLFDLDPAVLQVLLQTGSPHADVVRPLQRFHSLVERADRRLGLGAGRHHERRSLTTDTFGSSVYALLFCAGVLKPRLSLATTNLRARLRMHRRMSSS